MHRAFLSLSRLMAILGGMMLSAVILLTVFSVLMRALDRLFHWMKDADFLAGLGQWMIDAGVGPVLGTFELIEAGVGFVVFAFLPICQITGGHATVDIFTSQMSDGTNRVLRGVTEVIFAAVLVLIAAQLYGGMMAKFNSGQTTLELSFPVWYSYAIGLTGAVLAAIVSVYLAAVRMVELVTGRAMLPADLGAEH
ncbi:TRAP transporter small permease [Gymnodinialimonas ceratoperidinii]|uniref:TRAP transporter small permease protein n=1 Tax=Gymnodinialimonas ceratoperidinii TaxID=2856823 RepID=A0A8F6TX76_9RHOB|nr:TRAP transporter small permease [Gymnodinialimonas ceratoperidinii]QXT39588.1 TRAP transporter small permease [Gymnodinialimonas ceratoperidinii]